MDKTVERYYRLKKKQKEVEQELATLREQIIGHCREQEVSELAVSGYKVKIVAQERREYDDQKLHEALPDADVWRLVSRSDPSRIAGLVKLNVINEEALKGTYLPRKVFYLQIERT